jgi:hypothetical protein
MPTLEDQIREQNPWWLDSAAHLVPGARRAVRSGLIENLVAAGLYRSATDRLVQAGAVACLVAKCVARPTPGG